MDLLVRWHQTFERLPFVARRAILTALSLSILAFGVKVQPFSNEIAGAALLAGWVLFVWATGVWIALRGALVVAAWVLWIFY